MAVVHRRPGREFVRYRPCDAVLLVGEDIREIPEPHFEQLVLELKTGCTFAHDHPRSGVSIGFMRICACRVPSGVSMSSVILSLS